MSEKISRVIIQSSILFVTVFTTLSMLFGTVSSEFKSIYFYLGYMLYYSLPFILACFLGIVSMISQKSNYKLMKVIVQFEISFFLTGLMMLIWLATSAANTAFLPASYVFYSPPSSLAFLEFFLFISFFAALMASESSIDDESTKKDNHFRGLRKWVKNWRITKRIVKFSKKFDVKPTFASIMLLLFIVGIMLTAVYGVTQTKSIAKSGSVALQIGNPLNFTSSSFVNVSLEQSDQVSIQIKGENGRYLSYVFLDENNYPIYMNQSITNLTPQIINQDVGTNLRFSTVMNYTGRYYLIMRSNSIGETNATYSISVTRTNNSNQQWYFLASTVFMVLFLMTIKQSRKKQTSFYRYLV